MGIFDAFLNPNAGAAKGSKKAQKDFKRTRQQVDPFYSQMVGGGGQAYGKISDFLGLNGQGSQQSAFDNFSMSPAYQANFDAGQKAIDQSAAARGSLQSGAALKALQGYGQNQYNNEYRNHLGDLSGLVQGGYSGAQGLTNNSKDWGNLRVQQGQQQDLNNQGGLANVLGAVGTGISMFTGMPMGGGGGGGFSSMFGGGGQSMPTYGNGQVNPWAIY